MIEVTPFITAKAKPSKATSDLIFAVQHKMPNSLRSALRRGANVNIADDKGNNLLHVCRDPQIGSLLITAGTNVNARNANYQTPLHTSMRNGNVNLTKLLLLHKADVNAQENDGTAPLHLAENAEINTLLLESGANPDIQNKAGDTPLHIAIRHKGLPIISSLLAYGANKLIPNNAGIDAMGEVQRRLHTSEQDLSNIDKAVTGNILNIEEEPCNTLSSGLDSSSPLAPVPNANSARVSQSPLLNLPAFSLARQRSTARPVESGVVATNAPARIRP